VQQGTELAGDVRWRAPPQVEPEIVGGVIVQLADKYIDLSIRTRVKKIEQLILETV